MTETDPALVEAVARQREVTLITQGRKTGKPVPVTIWIASDGKHLYVRSGQGMRRHWPKNLVARGEADLQLGGQSLRVKPRHVTDPAEARAVSQLAKSKYGPFVKASKPDQPLTLGEQATFELIPAS
jgi:deazaflavin-dependent oxidoreductase (nitroreductase family)